MSYLERIYKFEKKIVKNHFLGAILLFVCIFLSCSSISVPGDNKTKKDQFDLYILMGQSNMAGRGELTDSMKSMHNENVLMLTRDLKWVIAGNPIHFDKPSVAGVGPGLSFGMAMSDAHPGVKIGLIPCAVGGTSIDKWQPGAFDSSTSTHPYDDAVLRIAAAMKYGKVKGVLWLQGESDSNEISAPKYLEKFKVLIQRVRELTGDKNLPVVAGELGRFKTTYQFINNELYRVPSVIPHAALATSEGLTDKGDKTHFDAKSATIFGKRFALQMLKLQSEKK